jgi:hypothetical protein
MRPRSTRQTGSVRGDRGRWSGAGDRRSRAGAGIVGTLVVEVEPFAVNGNASSGTDPAECEQVAEVLDIEDEARAGDWSADRECPAEIDRRIRPLSFRSAAARGPRRGRRRPTRQGWQGKEGPRLDRPAALAAKHGRAEAEPRRIPGRSSAGRTRIGQYVPATSGARDRRSVLRDTLPSLGVSSHHSRDVGSSSSTG